MLAAQVGRQNDQRIREVYGAALAIGQAAIVQHLKQDVEHVGMGFLDLVK